MTQSRKYEQDLAASTVAVAVVTFDSNFLAMRYIQDTKLDWPLLLDSDRQLYRVYKMEHGDWRSLYGPTSIWRYLHLMFRGQRLKRPGEDFRQLGGDVLIDPNGIVRLHYVSNSPHDRPTPLTILNVVSGTQS